MTYNLGWRKYVLMHEDVTQVLFYFHISGYICLCGSGGGRGMPVYSLEYPRFVTKNKYVYTDLYLY